MTYPKFLRVGLLSAAAVLLTATFPPTVVASVAPERAVSLYTGPNYSGTELIFTPEQAHRVTLKAQYKDQVSSLKVPKGYSVSLIDADGDRPYKRFEAGDHAFVGEQMNNKADTIVVSFDPSGAR